MNPALEQIARRYLSGRAGRTGAGQRDLLFPLNDLLRDCGCLRGLAREEAVREMEQLSAAGILVLERAARDPSAILRVRLPLEKAEEFLARCGLPSPARRRNAIAEILRAEASAPVPGADRESWQRLCAQFAECAEQGKSIDPLDPSNEALTLELLATTRKLLAWRDESYLRFASCVLCGDSKRLEILQPRLERLLDRVTGGRIPSFAALGITETGGGCWLHGPGTLDTPRGTISLDALHLPAHFSRSDLLEARLGTPASRWLTVENETMLHELAKLHGGVLLLSSGFRGGAANSAVIELLRRAPAGAELWHFGDSDPKGFDILRDLRARSGREIRALHMAFRPSATEPVSLTAPERKLIQTLLLSPTLDAEEKAQLTAMQRAGHKGKYEQESLGVPSGSWPFYPAEKSALRVHE